MQYEDDVRKRIEAAVQKKVEGEQIAISPNVQETGGAQVIDLMEALRASVEKAAGKRAAAKPTAAQAAPAEGKARRARKAVAEPVPAEPLRRKAGKR
jgi:DNA end-binding protein Ku